MRQKERHSSKEEWRFFFVGKFRLKGFTHMVDKYSMRQTEHPPDGTGGAASAKEGNKKTIRISHPKGGENNNKNN